MTHEPACALTTSTLDSSNIERLSPGLTREWLSGRVVIYTLTDSRRETIDAWVAAFKADIANWPADRPFLVLHDFSIKGAISTPYGRRRAQELVDARPDVKGRAAIVFPRNALMITMIQLFLSQQRNPARQQHVFSTRELGIAWLLDTRHMLNA